MCGNGQVLRLLHLLQYRVRLTGSVNVARHQQYRNVVSSCGSSSGNHVAGARTYRRSADKCLLAAQLTRECNSCQSHALLVLALIYFHVLDFLLNTVAVANAVAVARDHEDTANKLLFYFLAVHVDVADILVLQEADARLASSQTDSFHVSHWNISSSCNCYTILTLFKSILFSFK